MATEFDYTPLVIDCIMNMLNGYNTGMTKEQFYSANIIDTSDVTEDMLHEVNDCVVEYCRENGCYAALPPFEEGSFIDREQSRYIHWHILEVCEDYFRIELDHYPVIDVDRGNSFATGYTDDFFGNHRCWYRSCHIIVKVKFLNDAEHKEMISHHPDYVKYADSMCNGDVQKKSKLLDQLAARLKSDYYIGGVIEDYEFFMPQDFKKIAKKGKYYTSTGEFVNGAWVREVTDLSDKDVADKMNFSLQTILFASTGPLLEMFTYVNYMLSQKSVGSSTHRKVSSAYLINPELTELRKERHFGNLKIISEKKPRSVNATNIQRIYTTAAWQRRGHLRHYASGKVVPIRAATCHRQGLGDALAPQIVYKV